jgi:hypothetical protein
MIAPEMTNLQRAMRLIQMEYVEMAGLQLTLPQAARLWAMPIGTCAAVFDTLVTAGFLREIRNGKYARSGAPPLDNDALESLMARTDAA